LASCVITVAGLSPDLKAFRLASSDAFDWPASFGSASPSVLPLVPWQPVQVAARRALAGIAASPSAAPAANANISSASASISVGARVRAAGSA
jgi:hypothetical protein